MSRRKEIRRMRELLESSDWDKRLKLTTKDMRDAVRAVGMPYQRERMDLFDVRPVRTARVVFGPSAMGKTTSIPAIGSPVIGSLLSTAHDLQRYRDAEAEATSVLHGAVRMVRGSVRINGIEVASVLDRGRGVVIMGNGDEPPLWVAALRARDRAEAGVRLWRADPVRVAFMRGSVARAPRGARTTPRPPL